MSLANTLILAAGDKKDLGNSFLSWRPSVFSLNLGKRDRMDSGESRVTVSSVYSTSTVTSLADSGVKAGVNCEHYFKKDKWNLQKRSSNENMKHFVRNAELHIFYSIKCKLKNYLTKFF